MKVAFDLSVTSAVPGKGGPVTNWNTAWNSPNSATAAGLVLDFLADVYGSDGTLGSTMPMQRGSDGTLTNLAGALELVGSNTARIDHDPITLAPSGLLMESARTNRLTYSEAPSDQTLQVSAVPHVLSFYGTGTISLSGAHFGPFSGSAAYPTRTSILFTPTNGDLTVTFSGDISAPQIEEGIVASSYIPTSPDEVTRSDDVASVGLGGWFNPTAGTLVFSGSLESALANDRIIETDTGSTSTRMSLLWNTVLGKPQFQVWDGGAIAMGDHFRVAIAYSSDDFVVSLNGSGLATDAVGTVPTGLTTLRLGRSIWGAQGLMTAESLIYYPTRLSNEEVQALSA